MSDPTSTSAPVTFLGSPTIIPWYRQTTSTQAPTSAFVFELFLNYHLEHIYQPPPDASAVCPICYETYKMPLPEKYILGPPQYAVLIKDIPGCKGHHFHLNCIMNWPKSRQPACDTCPMCRTPWLALVALAEEHRRQMADRRLRAAEDYHCLMAAEAEGWRVELYSDEQGGMARRAGRTFLMGLATGVVGVGLALAIEATPVRRK
ncbi:hypothetical protein BU26DRAFT_105207 [Trematosphaeria pertusa]|uniref:RING-type domain-containing protein n=1 Tax=Trematosphaeria pertusa TaxID=390896 RepID=A0A6A6HZH3_9PLEO|nr:uncharacterized protein BU26DRAFT_105207 [Trematosphaeria pertusa]KAF2243595.1 hypothetical protein BU26DRAFT_105207 [Trematosphaeria pertusa]